MEKRSAYLIIDFGTGNLRAAVMSPTGELLGVSREDIVYHRDENYIDSIYFDPVVVWQRILLLSKIALEKAGHINIRTITATSQREGLVILNRNGEPVVGMPNIDHRGRGLENDISNKDFIYQKTGRFPTSLFSALKIKGYEQVYGNQQLGKVLSISDWIGYMFCGIMHYEHSQASETLLYDVAEKQWSDQLLRLFDLNKSLLPDLLPSGSLLGKIKPFFAGQWGINADANVVVGGADTQMAALSVNAGNEDVVIVSGTTTPIIKLIKKYVTDPDQRTWIGQHVMEGYFMLEANAGVTGLNYQRLKKIFYPNEEYKIMEQEINNIKDYQCIAALGSLLADEKKPLIRGGFIFPVPVNQELSRAHFAWATLWDIACSIYENFKSLDAVSPILKNNILTCGGGMESKKLRQFLAALTNKKVQINDNFRLASAVGGVMLCNRALQVEQTIKTAVATVVPEKMNFDHHALYQQWKENRNTLKEILK